MLNEEAGLEITSGTGCATRVSAETETGNPGLSLQMPLNMSLLMKQVFQIGNTEYTLCKVNTLNPWGDLVLHTGLNETGLLRFVCYVAEW